MKLDYLLERYGPETINTVLDAAYKGEFTEELKQALPMTPERDGWEMQLWWFHEAGLIYVFPDRSAPTATDGRPMRYSGMSITTAGEKLPKNR